MFKATAPHSEEQLNEILGYMKMIGGMMQNQESGEFDLDFQELGVRPLRTNIIESVKRMPSYYEGRQTKDPIKPKQFEM